MKDGWTVVDLDREHWQRLVGSLHCQESYYSRGQIDKFYPPAQLLEGEVYPRDGERPYHFGYKEIRWAGPGIRFICSQSAAGFEPADTECPTCGENHRGWIVYLPHEGRWLCKNCGQTFYSSVAGYAPAEEEVSGQDACPACGERRSGRLALADRDTSVFCTTCGTEYQVEGSWEDAAPHFTSFV